MREQGLRRTGEGARESAKERALLSERKRDGERSTEEKGEVKEIRRTTKSQSEEFFLSHSLFPQLSLTRLLPLLSHRFVTTRAPCKRESEDAAPSSAARSAHRCCHHARRGAAAIESNFDDEIDDGSPSPPELPSPLPPPPELARRLRARSSRGTRTAFSPHREKGASEKPRPSSCRSRLTTFMSRR